jgi:hypothetical protein
MKLCMKIVTDSDSDSMLFRPVASTIPILRTSKFLRWIELLAVCRIGMKFYMEVMSMISASTTCYLIL